jgi:transposase
MLSVAAGAKVFLAAKPVDLRRGHDGLSALVRTRFGMDPLDGHLFVFVGRRIDRVPRGGRRAPAGRVRRRW